MFNFNLFLEAKASFLLKQPTLIKHTPRSRIENRFAIKYYLLFPITFAHLLFIPDIVICISLYTLCNGTFCCVVGIRATLVVLHLCGFYSC